MPKPESDAVALLYQTAAPGEDMRAALAGSGLRIAYEAPVDDLDSVALRNSGAHSVVVDLDADDEAQLDSVERLLDDARYHVIFNDAEVSTRLSGWERARWLRHLIAKIRGAGDVDPPRPHAIAAERAAPSADTGSFRSTLNAERFSAPASAAAIASEPPSASALLSATMLELVPMEDAIAPVVAAPMMETWLDPDAIDAAGPVSQVWVLGASIGGPEAVGEFLAALPRGYPALFLLVQQMGSEFIEPLTRQLARSTPLAVRQLLSGDSVADGDVLIVAPGQRVLLDARGRVTLAPMGDDAQSASAIDRAIGEMADRFGARAGAILFSGTIAEAAAGSQRLVGKGGSIYAQDPASCVAGAVADDAAFADKVAFLGSPKQLAEKLLAQTPRAASAGS